jgi:hypothetical protein
MSQTPAQPAIPASAKVVTIHQPHYLPWLGLIAKIACADIFIYLDDVQYEKNGWQNRNQYSTRDGLKFLSLPVQQKGIVSQEKTVREVLLADPRAPLKHWKTLQQRYGKAPGWKRLAPRLEAILTPPQEKLIALCLATTELSLEIYQLKPQILFSSELRVEGQKGERVINLVKAAGANHYLSGTGAEEYLEPAAFAAAGLGLTFQEFRHPIYAQGVGDKFAPAAFALEFYLMDPDGAVEAFHAHLNGNTNQPVRCRI